MRFQRIAAKSQCLNAQAFGIQTTETLPAFITAETGESARSEHYREGMNVTTYIGFDIHKKTISCCVKQEDAKIVDEGLVSAKRLETDDLGRASAQAMDWSDGIKRCSRALIELRTCHVTPHSFQTGRWSGLSFRRDHRPVGAGTVALS